MQIIADKEGVRHYLVTLNVNGDSYTRVVKANTTLVNVLRYDLNLTGTKRGCELGDCGSCTVLLGGKPVNSCLILAVEADGPKLHYRAWHKVKSDAVRVFVNAATAVLHFGMIMSNAFE